MYVPAALSWCFCVFDLFSLLIYFISFDSLGYIGQNFNPLDLAVWSSKYRTDAADYEMRVVTSDGATNNPTNPGVEAALDTQTVAGIIYPLPSGEFIHGLLRF